MRYVDKDKINGAYKSGNLGEIMYQICRELRLRNWHERYKKTTQSILSRYMNKVFGFTRKKK
jgi:hypothetical protein